MSFYESIADQYDQIFPLKQPQVTFTTQAFEQVEKLNLLDIGCGTGSLSDTLGAHFHTVTGIDLDDAMLKKARSKSMNKVDFKHLDMLKIENEFGGNSFDAVLCYGNTIVHLPDIDQIGNFFKQVKAVLSKDGKFLFQIINYDRIIERNIKGLPIIENDSIKFARNYSLNEKGLIEFKTDLLIKSTGKKIKNNVLLFPIKKHEIEVILKNAGFKNWKFYANFKKEKWSLESIPLIVETTK